jgi:sulfur relay (sulfurtransferase) DsrF/TusC family protein
MENMEALQMKMPKAFPVQDHDAHIAAHSLFIKTRMVQINPAVYALLQGHISEHISQKASQEVVEALAANPAEKMLAKTNPEMFTVKMNGLIAQRTVELTSQLQQAEASGEQKVDPLVALKQRELDLRAMDLQIKQNNIATDNALNASQFKVDTLMTQQELEIKDRQSNDRLNIAKEKIQLARDKQNKK